MENSNNPQSRNRGNRLHLATFVLSLSLLVVTQHPAFIVSAAAALAAYADSKR